MEDAIPSKTWKIDQKKKLEERISLLIILLPPFDGLKFWRLFSDNEP